MRAIVIDPEKREITERGVEQRDVEQRDPAGAWMVMLRDNYHIFLLRGGEHGDHCFINTELYPKPVSGRAIILRIGEEQSLSHCTLGLSAVERGTIWLTKAQAVHIVAASRAAEIRAANKEAAQIANNRGQEMSHWQLWLSRILGGGK